MKSYVLSALVGIGSVCMGSGLETYVQKQVMNSTSSGKPSNTFIISRTKNGSSTISVNDSDGIRDLVFEGFRTHDKKIYKIPTQSLEHITGVEQVNISTKQFDDGDYTIKVYAKDMEDDVTSRIIHFSIKNGRFVSKEE